MCLFLGYLNDNRVRRCPVPTRHLKATFKSTLVDMVFIPGHHGLRHIPCDFFTLRAWLAPDFAPLLFPYSPLLQNVAPCVSGPSRADLVAILRRGLSAAAARLHPDLGGPARALCGRRPAHIPRVLRAPRRAGAHRAEGARGRVAHPVLPRGVLRPLGPLPPRGLRLPHARGPLPRSAFNGQAHTGCRFRVTKESPL